MKTVKIKPPPINQFDSGMFLFTHNGLIYGVAMLNGEWMPHDELDKFAKQDELQYKITRDDGSTFYLDEDEVLYESRKGEWVTVKISYAKYLSKNVRWYVEDDEFGPTYFVKPNGKMQRWSKVKG